MSTTLTRAQMCTALVLPALQDVLGARLRGLIVKGSAVHGDFIPHYSDLDLHAFVDDAALVAPQTLSTPDTLALQARLGALSLDMLGLSSLQLYVLSWTEGYPPEWVTPWPEMYDLVYGELPVGFTDASREQHMRSAHECMRLFPGWKQGIVRRAINSTDAALPAIARELGALVKPMAFIAATLMTGNPRLVWTGSWPEALEAIEPAVSRRKAFSAFFNGVQRWPPTTADARRLIQIGSDAIDDAWSWYGAQTWPEADLDGIRELKPW